MNNIYITAQSTQHGANRDVISVSVTTNYQLLTINSLKNTILFMHSFGGLSPPKSGRSVP